LGGLAKELRVYRNCDVVRVAAFVPPGHKHLRLVLELEDLVVVLHEATVAAIVRAYIDVVTHPTRRAVELVRAKLTARKQGYAEYQLVESGRPEEEVVGELCKALSGLCVEDADPRVGRTAT